VVRSETSQVLLVDIAADTATRPSAQPTSARDGVYTTKPRIAIRPPTTASVRRTLKRQTTVLYMACLCLESTEATPLML